MQPSPRQHAAINRVSGSASFPGSRSSTQPHSNDARSFSIQRGKWPYHLHDSCDASTREEELFQDELDHRLSDFQQQRSEAFPTSFLSSVHPLPRQYEDRSFEAHHPLRQQLRSQSLDGGVQLHGRPTGDCTRQSLTQFGDFDWQESPSSPSTSISDVDMLQAHTNQPRIQLDEKQEIGDETKGSTPSQGNREPVGLQDEPTTRKTSRYLREMDRRIILRRLTNGEKQAALAREYHVSRSTICNLYKQRQAVWARHDENPLSLHPKKSSRKQALATLSVKKNSDRRMATPTAAVTNYSQHLVVEVKSRALSLLLTAIRNRETSPARFQRCSSRAMRLLLEESVALLADTPTQRVWHRGYAFDAPVSTRPLYAVSLERKKSAMLETFQCIERDSPSSSFWPSSGGRSCLSLSLDSYDVVLLDMATASADLVCAAIRMLCGSGAQEAHISLVSLFVSTHVITRVHLEHPLVRISTACVDAELHHGYEPTQYELESASRMFLERFHAGVN